MHFIRFMSSGSGTITTTTPTTAVIMPTEENESPDTSIVFVILVIAVAIIVSASIYLLLRYLNRHRRSLPDPDVLPTTTTTVSFHHHRHDLFSSSSSRRRVSPDDHHIQNRALIESLPLFSFDSVKAPLSSADCAVCLSKFQPRDQLRLLPLCCHAFHAFCVDTWLVSNRTCPLCRSTVVASDSEIYSHHFPTSAAGSTTATDVDPPSNNSFRLEIGTVSRRRLPSDSGDVRRSYSLGSFEYIVDQASEVFVAPAAPEDHGYRRGASDCEIEFVDDKIAMEPQPPGASLAAEVASGSSGRYWLRELASSASHLSLSSRRSSGRFFTGSNVWDWEANRIGEEISELFRWFSGV
ncbi:Zinc finger, RING-type [Dillenia turbinata]|uniref:Zinc finger, RING-type n=1 Tax=Dillenia turbinata TaxID=194707 RepID=A0AAN8Z086_9MAGN